jgi:hypothetical protein
MAKTGSCISVRCGPVTWALASLKCDRHLLRFFDGWTRRCTAAPTDMPNFASSPWMRTHPQLGLSLARRVISCRVPSGAAVHAFVAWHPSSSRAGDRP